MADLQSKIGSRLASVKFAAGTLTDLLAGAEIPPTHEMRLAKKLDGISRDLLELLKQTRSLLRSQSHGQD